MQKNPLANYLQNAPSIVVTIYAMAVSFATYFCMYAFRKPYTAGTFNGQQFLGTAVGLKTALVIGQLLGYTASKYLGVKICSEADRGGRARTLVLLILAAEAALVLFAVAPPALQPLVMLLNGLPLGMVWGLVVWYLEGRRASEVMLSALSCAFIVSSGVVKDIGRWVLDSHTANQWWMPAVVGAMFLPAFIVLVWLLNQMPEPNAEDIAARTLREPMTAADRKLFLRRFLPGLLPLAVVSFFIVAFRDFRDNFGVEIFNQLGYSGSEGIFTRSELVVAFTVMGTMSLLSLIRDNKLALMAAYGLMAFGTLLMGFATLLLDAHRIHGLAFMILVGIGSFLTYVPFNAVFFDRLIARTRFVGTAVFGIYLVDSIGYTGSIGIQLFKDLGESSIDRLTFFRYFNYGLSVVGTVLLTVSALYFMRDVVVGVAGTAAARATAPDDLTELSAASGRILTEGNIA